MTDRATAREVFERSLALLSAGAVQEWVDLFHPDGVAEFPFAPPGLPRTVAGGAPTMWQPSPCLARIWIAPYERAARRPGFQVSRTMVAVTWLAVQNCPSVPFAAAGSAPAPRPHAVPAMTIPAAAAMEAMPHRR